jgi:hypothetical protein
VIKNHPLLVEIRFENCQRYRFSSKVPQKHLKKHFSKLNFDSKRPQGVEIEFRIVCWMIDSCFEDLLSVSKDDSKTQIALS